MPTFDFYAKRMETTVETKPKKRKPKKFGLPTNKQKTETKNFGFFHGFHFGFF